MLADEFVSFSAKSVMKKYYCMNGIKRGYLNVLPCDALMLAIITNTNLSVISKIIIGIPTSIKHNGIVRTI